jgi:hypothetical protein
MKLSSSFNALPPVAKPLPSQETAGTLERVAGGGKRTTTEPQKLDSFTSSKEKIADVNSLFSTFTGVVVKPYEVIWQQFSSTASETLFEKSFEELRKIEGDVSNHPNDRGGLTNLGITQETYDLYQKKYQPNAKPKLVDQITEAEAKEIYRDYWVQSGADKLALTDPALAFVRFDTWVNGFPQRWVKQNLWHNTEDLLIARETYYRNIVAKHPKQEVFLDGWLKRLKTVKKFIADL